MRSRALFLLLELPLYLCWVVLYSCCIVLSCVVLMLCFVVSCCYSCSFLDYIFYNSLTHEHFNLKVNIFQPHISMFSWQGSRFNLVLILCFNLYNCYFHLYYQYFQCSSICNSDNKVTLPKMLLLKHLIIARKERWIYY